MKSISVFCGSSDGNDNEIITTAYALGKEFAQKDITLVYGAAKIGIMGKVAEGVIENGGKTVGIIPSFLKTKEIVHTELTELNKSNDTNSTHEITDENIIY